MPSLIIHISVVKEKEYTLWLNQWSHASKLLKLKLRSRHVMSWEFKNNKKVREAAKKNCSVYEQRVILDRRGRNWFSKFSFADTSLKDEPSGIIHSEFFSPQSNIQYRFKLTAVTCASKSSEKTLQICQ